ncbi:MAG: hypothetical protein ATN35_00125 [Epulopiscium sp. Nele67-Bin004]|nr:MAG: hypothetical protein ATN35_00125 [Epulopiscium sp. Nele67-Bin004]
MFAVEFKNIIKEFPGVKALKSVSFGIEDNTIHALMGENGAGKSTLLKILGGSYIPNSGEILIKGQESSFLSVHDSMQAKIAIIYQELNLVQEMTVYENIFLGQMPVNSGVINRKKMIAESAALLKDLDETISPTDKIKSLSIGQQQLVEIAKSLNKGADIIAFDEPTSSLSSKETDKLFTIIRDLRKKGKTIIYVSHRMDEIFALCSSITVFRDGMHVITYDNIKHITRDMLIEKMLGNKLGDMFEYRSCELGNTYMSVENLTAHNVPYPISFSIRKKEILGFFGLVGAGRTELMKAIYGAEGSYDGKVVINGKEVCISSPKDAIRNKIAYCSEDRRKDGIVPLFSITENVCLVSRQTETLINSVKEEAFTELSRTSLNIKTPNLEQQIKFLSGGNQQKCLLARWFSDNPIIDLIILDEPTRGIDVGAKKEIYQIIHDLRSHGKTVIVVSSELPELMGICDRIITMCENEITGDFARKDFNQQDILDMCFSCT